MNKEPVKIWERPSKNGSSFTYCLIYTGIDGKRHRKSLGHFNKRKAEKQARELAEQLRYNYVEPQSMRLSRFVDDSLRRTAKQIRESTTKEYNAVMRGFIKVVGDIDYKLVTLYHGEKFVQACLDKGNANDTVAKKVRTVKRFFNLALQRDQLEKNPLRFLKAPKRRVKAVRIFSTDECSRLLKAAQDWPDRSGLRWDILIVLALTTAMRKGELLNLAWNDIDFERQTITVTPKANTSKTWLWEIKDAEERVLPLTDEVTTLLAEHQQKAKVGCPYVFVPYPRYEIILDRCRMGNWTLTDTRLYIIGNFSRRFQELCQRAGIQRSGTFHDLRRTALSEWLHNNMSIYDVMRLAGHSDITTTQKFYLASSDDISRFARVF